MFWEESNPWPVDYKTTALPAELQNSIVAPKPDADYLKDISLPPFAHPLGIEPSLSGLESDVLPLILKTHVADLTAEALAFLHHKTLKSEGPVLCAARKNRTYLGRSQQVYSLSHIHSE